MKPSWAKGHEPGGPSKDRISLCTTYCSHLSHWSGTNRVQSEGSCRRSGTGRTLSSLLLYTVNFFLFDEQMKKKEKKKRTRQNISG